MQQQEPGVPGRMVPTSRREVGLPFQAALAHLEESGLARLAHLRPGPVGGSRHRAACRRGRPSSSEPVRPDLARPDRRRRRRAAEARGRAVSTAAGVGWLAAGIWWPRRETLSCKARFFQANLTSFFSLTNCTRFSLYPSSWKQLIFRFIYSNCWYGLP
jgi:hypothetical protein